MSRSLVFGFESKAALMNKSGVFHNDFSNGPSGQQFSQCGTGFLQRDDPFPGNLDVPGLESPRKVDARLRDPLFGIGATVSRTERQLMKRQTFIERLFIFFGTRQAGDFDQFPFVTK